MNTNTTVLRTTQKGYLGLYLAELVWIGILLTGATLLSGYIDSVYAKLGVDSFKAFEELDFLSRFEYEEAVVFSYGGMVLSYVVIGIIALSGLGTAIYSTKTVTTLHKNSAGRHEKLVSESFGFPFAKETAQVIFDRITDITVRQSGMGRLLNTGDLEITTITFTNAEAKEQKWEIPAIEGPYEKKAEIESALVGHEGLLVKVRAG
ncbi:MAG: PH domain-containing protein [bacterium]|nr:PH domain-containing protein [bacterium]